MSRKPIASLLLGVALLAGLMRVDAQCGFTVNAGNDTTVCANQTFMLSGSVTPAGSYTYAWTTSAGTIANSTSLNPIITPDTTGMFYLTVTNSTPCSETDSVLITTSGVAMPVQATVSPAVVCPGQQVQLNATATPINCGLTVACGGTITSPAVGVGPAVEQPGTVTQGPTIMGNWNKSERNEMLYTGAELQTALGPACTLTGIGFNLAVTGGNEILNNFTISIVCTNQNSLTTWDNSVVLVYDTSEYKPPNSTGWTYITFNNAYNWDGMSGLIVDICWYDMGTFGNENCKVWCTNTTFDSYIWAAANADECGLAAGAPTLSMTRPNIALQYCVPNINNFPLKWVPLSGANAVSDAYISNPTANPVTSTNYTIIVDTTSVCPGTVVVNVQVDTSKLAVTGDTNSCPGLADTLRAIVTGAVIPGPPVFAWTTLAGTAVGTGDSAIVSPTVNTTYIVTMTGGACTKSDTISVNMTGLTVSATPTELLCFNDHDGSILAASANGISPFTYTWSAAAATGDVNDATGLAIGTYDVTITDVNGCSGSASALVTQPAILAPSFVVNPVTCFGYNDGSITINPSGGTPPYTYQWNNGEPPDRTDSDLVANTYSISITDSNNCVTQHMATVTQPPQIVFGVATIQGVNCFGGNSGQITTSAAGGTGALSYSWSQDTALNSTTATNLTAGTYTVTATDTKNCTATASYTVAQPLAPILFNAPNITQPTCFGGNDGSATVNAVGGTPPYTYLWTPSAQTTQTATGLTAQFYSVLVTDDSLCTATDTFTVGQPLQIQFVGQITNVDCNGNSTGAINLQVVNGVGPFVFIWSNTATTQNISNLPAGTYSVTVTDANNCQNDTSFVVTQYPPLVLNAPDITNVACTGQNNGSITANPSGGNNSGGYLYNWFPSGTSQTISGLVAGNYSLTVTDGNGCTDMATYTVTQPASAPAIINDSIENILCNGATSGSITLTVNGGTLPYSYSWANLPLDTGPVASNLAAGNYNVTITDAEGCSTSNTYTVSQSPPITFGDSIVTNVSCNGQSNGSAQVTPTGGGGSFSYTWNGTPNGNPAVNLPADIFQVVVTDQYNCTASTVVIVSQPPAMEHTEVIQNATCYNGANGSIDITPTGGNPPYDYAWSAPPNKTGPDNAGLTAGDYVVTVTDSKGCSIAVSDTIAEPTNLVYSASATQVSCPGDSDGTITVTATGATPPYIYAVTKDEVNFRYESNGVITGLDSGFYIIQISDSFGCTWGDTITVPYPIPDSFALTVDSTSCYGAAYADGGITITPLVASNGSFQFSIDSGAFQYLGVFAGLTAGEHYITAENKFGCFSYIDTSVPAPAQAYTSVLPKDTSLELNTSIQLTSSFTPYPLSTIVSYNWVPSLGLSCVDCPNPIASPYNHINNYTLTITYNGHNGHCVASDSLTIIILNDAHVYIPNSFSPNGDGNNDIFQVYGTDIKTLDMKVFNRWGELVYEGENPLSGWDGTYKGVLQNIGVYAYYVKITFLDDETAERTGTVTLVR